GRALVGLHPIRGGTITFGGDPYRPSDPAGALAKRVGFLSSDRKQEGILPNRSIRENLMLSSLHTVARFGCIEDRAEHREANERLATLGVKHASGEDFITTLSGRHQQEGLVGRRLCGA